jgi:outer membrane protein assembly factor BamB
LRIAGLNPETGAIQWEHPLVFQPAGVSPTPLVIGETLVCTTQETGTLALKFPKAEIRNLQPLWWKQDLNSYFSTGTLGPENSVLVVTNQQTPLPRADLRCLDLATGNELWLKKGVGYFHAGVLATGDGKLLFLDDTGSLILAEISRKEFKQLSKAGVCRGTLINPAFSGGRFVARDDKELVCVKLEAATASTSTPTPK